MKLRLPWQRSTESSAGDELQRELLTYYSDNRPSSWRAHSAVEASASLWSRALASAVVSPTRTALTPSVLARMGRQLLLEGECAYEVVINDQGLQLQPVTVEDVTGGPDPRTWRYLVRVEEPRGGWTSRRRRRPGASIVHVRINESPPWRGRSPFTIASSTSSLAARLEASLAEEADTTMGFVLPAPVDGQDQTVDDLREDIGSLKGELAVVESMTTGWDKQGPAPQGDWRVQRLGPAPPEPVVNLRDKTSMSLFALAGVPPELIGESQAAAGRDAYRRFVATVIEPVARLVAAELEVKLDLPGCELAFPVLRRDLREQGRVLADLVRAGLSVQEAAEVVGLELPS